jgi:glycosyltransferase involved in cell wall biosynthesis
MGTGRISVVTACFNEEENVEEVYRRVKTVFTNSTNYTYEHIFIDNSSTDGTMNVLKKLASQDRRVKIIVNARNFGHIRSPYHALLQARGDAVISLVADLQDPPELIPEMLKKWQSGFKIVACVKKQSRENPVMFKIRKMYYSLLAGMSDTAQIRNFTGFGLYDRSFIDFLKQLDEPYPYFRGLVAEFGFSLYCMEYIQPARKKGRTKNNLFTLYDMAMSGFVNNTKLPLRLASFTGFIVAGVSLIVALVYLVMKLANWSGFQMGAAPIVIGLFFFSSVQLIFIGIIGEYVGAIYTHIKHRPHVVEKERINF